MRTRHAFVAFALAAAAACSAPAPAPGPATGDDLTKINAVRDGFAAAFNAGDAAKVVDLYTADAVAMPSHHATVTGRDALLAYNRDFFNQMSAKVTITPVETTVSGNLGYDRGTYTMTVTPKSGGAPMNDQGKYVVVLQKQSDGSWKVTRDIDNSDLPMPAPPPPPAPEPAKGKAKGK
jgi:uncharacterized protein (TIGR02246 family)